MLHKSQLGRSMIEMLAVVAIIGILSIVTFWGYEMAMARHRANEVIKETNMLALYIEQQFDNELDDEEFDLAEWQGDGVLKLQVAGYSGDLTFDQYTTAFEVKLDDVQKDVCQRIMNSGWEQPYLIYVNGDARGPCDQDENTMAFAFNNTLDTDAPACNPRSGWNDETERCEPCADGQGKQDDHCQTCPENYYQYGDDCRPCPDGVETEAGSTECPCPSGSIWNNVDGTCDICPAGTYQRENTCVECPKGASSSAGSTTCNCPTGSTWVGEPVYTCDPPSCGDTYQDCPQRNNQYVACVEHICKYYTPVTYIQSSGSQYINTGLNCTYNGSDFTMKTAGDFTGNNGTWQGANAYLQHRFTGNSVDNGNGTYYSISNDDEITVSYNHTTHVETISIQSSGASWSRDWTPTTTITGNIYIFNLGKGNSVLSNSAVRAKLKYAKIYENGQLARDMHPAVDEQNKAGLFDEQTHTMFYDANGSNFTIPQ